MDQNLQAYLDQLHEHGVIAVDFIRCINMFYQVKMLIIYEKYIYMKCNLQILFHPNKINS